MPDGKTLYVILSANASAYKAALRGAAGDTREFARDVDRAGDNLDDLGGKSQSAGKEIDKMSGRLRIMLDALAMVGPAAVPITAAALPALSGLANMTALAGAGAGSMMLAFTGFGDTLKAIRTAELEPTADNLEKVREAMSKNSDAANQFARDLNDALPALNSIRKAAQAGGMDDMSRALDSFEKQIPEVSRLMYELADATGGNVADAVDSIGSDRWEGTFEFIRTEARPAISDMFHIVGDLTHGLAELWQAMDPASDDFTAGLRGAADDFDHWATTVDQTEGFQEFLDYTREVGPQVWDTLGSIGNALVQIVEAVAPISQVSLQGIEVLFDGLARIAGSPIGPTLFAAAAGLAAMNRSLQLTGGLMTRAGFTGAGARVTGAASGGILGTIGSGSRSAAGTLRQSVSQIRAGLGQVTAVYATAGARTERESARIKDGFKQIGAGARGVAAPVAGASAAIAGMAVLSTDTGRGIGLTNTAMLGLAGSMAGPPGAAIGAGVGLFLDMKDAANNGEEAVESFNSAVANVSSVTEYGNALRSLQGDVDGLSDSLMEKGLLKLNDIAESASGTQSNAVGAGLLSGFGVAGYFAGKAGAGEDAAQQRLKDAQQDYAALEWAARDLARAQGQSATSTEDLDAALRASQPAMNALGISTDELIHAARYGGLNTMIGDIEDWQRHADSAAGRTDTFADSVADLGRDALSTADSAAAMSAALDALLSPTLTAEEATDAWRASLQQLRSELKAAAGFKGFGEGAMENRALSRDYVNTSKERLTALAGLATTTEKDMARAVAQTRQEFIKSGMAAGFSRKEITRRANALGLTPRMVRTVFHAAGISDADLRARRLREVYEGLPKDVRTNIKANGIPATKQEVDELVDKYHLTEKQRTALLTLRDLASQPIGNVLQKLGIVDRYTAVPNVVLGGAQAVQSALANVSGWLSDLDGDSATTHVYVQRHGTGGGMGAAGDSGAAGGGTVPITGLGYRDRHRYLLADGEEVVSDDPARGRPATSYRPVLKAINRGESREVIRGMLAGGGTAGQFGSSLVTSQRPIVVRQPAAALPDHLTLVVDGHRFTAYVQKVAGPVARREINSDAVWRRRSDDRD